MKKRSNLKSVKRKKPRELHEKRFVATIKNKRRKHWKTEKSKKSLLRNGVARFATRHSRKRRCTSSI